MTEKVSTGIYPPYFNTYVSLVENEEMNSLLRKEAEEAEHLFSSIPDEKWLYKYKANKWTVKEVLQHITDTERVFNFRALAFSRRDPNTFPSFNENEYTKNSNANNRNPKDLLAEFLAVRKSTQLLFHGFSDEQLNAIGKASSNEMSVKGIGYIISGHFAHHVKILKERYL